MRPHGVSWGNPAVAITAERRLIIFGERFEAMGVILTIRRYHATAKKLRDLSDVIVIEIYPKERFFCRRIRPRGRLWLSGEIDPEVNRIIESCRVYAITVEVEN